MPLAPQYPHQAYPLKICRCRSDGFSCFGPGSTASSRGRVLDGTVVDLAFFVDFYESLKPHLAGFAAYMSAAGLNGGVVSRTKFPRQNILSGYLYTKIDLMIFSNTSPCHSPFGSGFGENFRFCTTTRTIITNSTNLRRHYNRITTPCNSPSGHISRRNT